MWYTGSGTGVDPDYIDQFADAAATQELRAEVFIGPGETFTSCRAGFTPTFSYCDWVGSSGAFIKHSGDDSYVLVWYPEPVTSYYPVGNATAGVSQWTG